MNKHGRNWLAPTTRLALYLRDGMACAYCGEGVEAGATLTADHIITRDSGGSNDLSNLITACHRCNSKRGNRELSEFVYAVAAYINHGATGNMIAHHIVTCTGRDMKPFRQQAQRIMKLRPAWGDALRLAMENGQ